MRELIKLLVNGYFLFLCLLSVQAVDLPAFRGVYQKNSEEILQSYQPKYDELQQQYQKALDALKAQVQAQGDLAKTKAAVAEIARFQRAKSLPATLDEKEIPEIKALQTGYVKQYAEFEKEMTAKLGSLTAKYVQALDLLQKELVKTGKLDEATEVQAERAKAQAAATDFAEQFVVRKGMPGAASAAPLKDLGKAAQGDYLAVDLSGGPTAAAYPVSAYKRLSDVPGGANSDVYKTTCLLLRRIPKGTFAMGSPENELGRGGGETLHQVSLTQDFYIGIFEVTQKQWERVMGDWPSYFKNPVCRDARPVEQVTYIDIRGSVEGAKWPASGSVDESSFMGRLRARTGRSFDLPTEAQWEYACRAGTITALNSGKNLTRVDDCPNAAAVGRNKYNGGCSDEQNGDTRVGSAKVGSYLPNAWGLYDMHGNLWEWCLDWGSAYSDVMSDPKGAVSGVKRINRGGTLNGGAYYGRSAQRSSYAVSNRFKSIGFRAGCGLGVVTSAEGTKGLAARPPSEPLAGSGKARERQAACAKRLGVPVEVVNSIGMRFVLIPPGEFDMGTSEADIKRELEEQARANPPTVEKFYFDRVPEEGPQHRVKISKPFYLSACEVTQGEYEQIMRGNPSRFSVNARGGESKKVAGKDTSRFPVENVSWDEAQEFTRRLSALTSEIQAQRTYRLPTEAEWEYACRADTTSRWFCGDDPASLVPYAWFKANGEGMTHPVGTKLPNAWGLFDLHGNVFEWCADHYTTNDYGRASLVDPQGSPEGPYRVVRGGEFQRHPWGCRSAYRGIAGASPWPVRAAIIGFRIGYGLEPGGSAQTAAERIRQAKELFEQGVLSKDAYDKKVKEIVDSL